MCQTGTNSNPWMYYRRPPRPPFPHKLERGRKVPIPNCSQTVGTRCRYQSCTFANTFTGCEVMPYYRNGQSFRLHQIPKWVNLNRAQYCRHMRGRQLAWAPLWSRPCKYYIWYANLLVLSSLMRIRDHERRDHPSTSRCSAIDNSPGSHRIIVVVIFLLIFTINLLFLRARILLTRTTSSKKYCAISASWRWRQISQINGQLTPTFNVLPILSARHNGINCTMSLINFMSVNL